MELTQQCGWNVVRRLLLLKNRRIKFSAEGGEVVGLIQKVLLDLVEAKAGPQAIGEVFRRAGVPENRVFRIGEVYADAEWARLFEAALAVLDLNESQALDAYADAFFSDAMKRFPKWFEMAKNSRMFLEFQTTIHNTFASGVMNAEERQAVKDKFVIEKLGERKIITHYRSPNRLCALYRTLAAWIANHYGDEIEISEPKCQLQGHEECEIHVHWRRFKGEH